MNATMGIGEEGEIVEFVVFTIVQYYKMLFMSSLLNYTKLVPTMQSTRATQQNIKLHSHLLRTI